jgi:cysteine desulfurase
LEKSISSRYYLDYNATSPLSKSVINFLGSGDFIFGNPSSIHTTGKKSKKFINGTIEYLLKLFQLSPTEFSLIFHSGATEGINSFFKGIALHSFKNKKKCAFFFSVVDHSAVINLEEDLVALGHEVYFFNVNHNGEFDLAILIDQIKNISLSGIQAIVNYTYVNNESGIVWPLERALKIKNETGALVHVDAVQLVGKIENWNKILPELDAYTFSGHKFGAMKSVGFTVQKKSLILSPWIIGGGQQAGLRAGTENALGIFSLKLALMDIIDSFNSTELLASRNLLEESLGQSCIIVGKSSSQRNLNTILAIFNGAGLSDLNMRFDLHGIDVSKGSACSSGIVKENRILLSMGFSKEDSLNAIRFSFSPTLSNLEAKKISMVIKKVLNLGPNK